MQTMRGCWPAFSARIPVIYRLNKTVKTTLKNKSATVTSMIKHDYKLKIKVSVRKAVVKPLQVIFHFEAWGTTDYQTVSSLLLLSTSSHFSNPSNSNKFKLTCTCLLLRCIWSKQSNLLSIQLFSI